MGQTERRRTEGNILDLHFRTFLSLQIHRLIQKFVLLLKRFLSLPEQQKTTPRDSCWTEIRIRTLNISVVKLFCNLTIIDEIMLFRVADEFIQQGHIRLLTISEQNINQRMDIYNVLQKT